MSSSSSAATAASDSDSDWVIPEESDCYYQPGRSAAGVFFPNSNGRHSFLSFNPNFSLSFLPPSSSSSIAFSSHGLLLSRGPWSSYHLSNPSLRTQIHTHLPKPRGPHPPNSPVALTLSGPTFYVIAALARRPGFYSFDVFTSAAAEWRRSSEKEFDLGQIIPNSGVSHNGTAYWRTDAPAVVGYDPSADQARTFLPPPAGDAWQLGVAGGMLCSVLAKESSVEVYALEPPPATAAEEERWRLVGSFGVVRGGGDWDGVEPIVCRAPPRPVRFESLEMEVVLWVDGKLVVVDLERRKMRVVAMEAPDSFGDYLPYVESSSAVHFRDVLL